jgi:hypothetical protein
MRAHKIGQVIIAVTVSSLFTAMVHAEPPAKLPPETPGIPTLLGSFTKNQRHAIFQTPDEVKAVFTISGIREQDDILLWTLKDYMGRTLEQGKCEVPQGKEAVTCHVQPGFHGSGYFELHARLEKANVTLPKLGSRPSGLITYGILPEIRALPLESPEDSRFGIMGTAFVESGVRMQGNHHDPLYSLLGVKWFYGDMRLQNLYGRKDKPYEPKLTEEALKWSHRSARAGKFALLWDLHSVPGWLMNAPKPIAQPEELNASHQCQRYAPRDFEAYGKLIEAVASEIAASRKHLFPYMRRNTYQIHWEPDWHWAGTEEDFIKMYETAYQAIRQVDPTAILAGPNFGLLAKGNRMLESLFQKGLGHSMNGIVTHAYFWNQDIPPEDMGLIPEMRKLVALRNQYLGPEAPLHQTEWGLSWKHKDRYLDVPHEELIRELAWSLRAHAIILGEGADSTWFFYACDKGGGGGGFVYNLDEPPTFGATMIAPKPLTMATCTFTRVLEGTQSLGPIKALGDDVYGYHFRRGDQLVAIVWSRQDTTRTVVDTGMPETILIDSMGNQKSVKTDAGRVELTVGPVPQYILGLSEDVLPSDVAITAVQGGVLNTGTIPREMIVSLARGKSLIPVLSAETALPEKMDLGEWLLRFSDADSGNLNRSVPVNVIKSFELLELDLVSPGNYSLKLRNNATAETVVTIGLLSDKNVGEAQRVTLPPESTKVIALSAPESLQAGDEIAVKAVGRGGVSETKEFVVGRIIPATDRRINPPLADGDLKDWTLESFTRLAEEKSLAFQKAPWAGAGDLSVLYSLAHDSKNFYFAFKVFDTTHFPPIKEEEPWRGDSLQLAFGLDMDASGGHAAKTKTISLELDGSGRTIVKELSKSPPVPPEVLGVLGNDVLTARVVRDDVDSTTIYEGAIPWEWITGGEKAQKIGFGAMVNDADNKDEVVQDGRKTMHVGLGAELFNITPQFHSLNTNQRPE